MLHSDPVAISNVHGGPLCFNMWQGKGVASKGLFWLQICYGPVAYGGLWWVLFPGCACFYTWQVVHAARCSGKVRGVTSNGLRHAFGGVGCMVGFVENIMWYKFRLQPSYFVVLWFDGGILWHRSWYILEAIAKCSWRAPMSLVGTLLANAIHGRIKLIAPFLLLPCSCLFGPFSHRMFCGKFHGG